MKSLTWTYSIRWTNPYTEAKGGKRVLTSQTVQAGEKCPAELKALHKPGSGFGICIDFNLPAPRKMDPEKKAKMMRTRKINKIKKRYPLFADQFIEQEGLA